jgi:hypothetical protein
MTQSPVPVPLVGQGGLRDAHRPVRGDLEHLRSRARAEVQPPGAVRTGPEQPVEILDPGAAHHDDLHTEPAQRLHA